MPDPRPGVAGVDPGVATALTGAEALARCTEDAAASRYPTLAGAAGAALGGLRTTAELDGARLMETLALWREAVARRLPLVVHLEERASGAALGSGHDAYHAATAGGLALFAANVQEAADFALVARQVAEKALLPALVALDGPETARAVQNLELVTPELAADVLGDPGATIHSPTAEQQLLFGKHRRRLPRWHDLERPLLSGPLLGPEAFALAGAARQAYAGVHLPELLDRALRELGRRTGRHHRAVSAHGTDDVRLVLVAQGAAIETLEAVADYLRAEDRLRVGVVGVRSWQPFPAVELAGHLKKAKAVAVFERVTPSGATPPLTSAVQGALSTATVPPLATVFYGLGGYPLRGGDVAALCRELATGKKSTWRSSVFVGVDFTATGTGYPKRQALIDSLLRSYPAIGSLGLRARGVAPDLVPRGSFTVVSCPVQGGEGLLADASRLLHRTVGGQLRGRPGLTWDRWDGILHERLTHAPRRRKKTSWPLRDPGDEVRADVAVAWNASAVKPEDLVRELAEGGVLLLESPPAEEAVHALAEVSRATELFVVPAGDPGAGHPAAGDPAAGDPAAGDPAAGDPVLRRERLLGALFSVLRNMGKVNVQPRRLFAAHREMLSGVDAEARAAAFEAGFTQAGPWTPPDPGSLAPRSAEGAADGGAVPPALRRRSFPGEHPGALPRFWDQIGVFYRRGEAGELVPDPLLATATIPAATAALRGASPERTELPEFDPAACTGCGACWTSCPDGAVGPIVIGARALVGRGLDLAQVGGTSAEALRPLVGKLTGALHKRIAAGEAEGGPAEKLFDNAFHDVLEKVSEDRQPAVQDSWEAVRATFCDLPVARTATFFDQPEAERKGSGELFALAIDPDACKGCGVCVASCEPEALRAMPESAERREAGRRLSAWVEVLPEPSAAAVSHARHSSEAGLLQGALLSRKAREVLLGGDGAEPGSGEKIAVRQVLGAAAFHLEPRRQGFLDEVAELRTALAGAVREGLAQSLPGDDLEALAGGLESLDRPDAALAELTARIEGSFESERVDVVAMRRLVDVARELADLDERMAPGEGRPGWAPFGVVVAGAAARWAGSFPRNPFTVPVTVAPPGGSPPGDSLAALAQGVVEGQLAGFVEAVEALRRARDLLEGRRQASVRRLGWEDLTPEERQAAPPLFVVASEDAVGADWVVELLAAKAPVKLVLLDGTEDFRELPEGVEAVGSSIAHGDALDEAVAGILAQDGSAVLRILAPCPGREGFPADAAVARARATVEAGGYPLLAEAPQNGGGELDEVAGAAASEAEMSVLRAEMEEKLAAARAGAETEMVERLRSRLRLLAHRAVHTVPIQDLPVQDVPAAAALTAPEGEGAEPALEE